MIRGHLAAKRWEQSDFYDCIRACRTPVRRAGRANGQHVRQNRYFFLKNSYNPAFPLTDEPTTNLFCVRYFSICNGCESARKSPHCRRSLLAHYWRPFVSTLTLMSRGVGLLYPSESKQAYAAQTQTDDRRDVNAETQIQDRAART